MDKIFEIYYFPLTFSVILIRLIKINTLIKIDKSKVYNSIIFSRILFN